MTISITHNYRFTTFRRLLVANENTWTHNSSCLKATADEALLEIKYNSGSECCNIEH